MLYNARGFSLALRPTEEPIARPAWMHFGMRLPDRDAVLALRDRFADEGVELEEVWDEPDYVSVKCRDPDGYIVEASWEPTYAGLDCARVRGSARWRWVRGPLSGKVGLGAVRLAGRS